MTKNEITGHSKFYIEYNRKGFPVSLLPLASKRNDMTSISILLENVNVTRLDINICILYVYMITIAGDRCEVSGARV